MRKDKVTLTLGALLAVLIAGCVDRSELNNLEEANTTVAEFLATDPNVASQESETDRLNEWFEAKYEEEVMMSPIRLTFLGRKERFGELDQMGEQATLERIEWRRNSIEEMQSNFDYAKLDENGKLSYDLWIYQFEDLERSKDFVRHDYIFEQMKGVHSFLPTLMMQFHTVEEESDMVAYVSRLIEIERAMGQLIEQAKLNAEAGVRPPRFAYEIVTKEAKDIISGKPFDDSEEDSMLLADAKAKIAALVKSGKIEQSRADELLSESETALKENFGPSYQALIAYLDKDVQNASQEPQGVHALPNGLKLYEILLRSNTTTDMSAEEVHQLGLAEVARLRALMEEVKEKDGFEGSLQEYFAFLRDDKSNRMYYFPNTDEGRQGYIDEATAAIDNIKAVLPEYFGLLPKAGLEVKRVESFREQDGAPQHYYPGTPDGSRPGIYYAHLSDMGAMPKNELEVIAYHEGLPGHHMQISIAQELEGIPTFRTQARFTAYIEGWALYSEALSKEMPGTFQTLNSEFGRLGSEIWRAIRLVVDTGLHHKGWSMQEAVDYFSANSPAPLETIEAEIRRYLVIPGQATSYKVGMIDIQRLRKYSEDALGSNFDIREFHDVILGGGALPLSLLDRKVKDWVKEKSISMEG